jgi:HSP20 family molecular chaperone IbpA
MNTTTPPGHERLLAPLALIPACQKGHGEADWFPAVDILEDGEEYLFRIDLPEVDSGEVQVAVEGDNLLVSGERPKPPAEPKKCLRIERPHGHFARRFALPDDASRRDIASAFDNGVLELRLRKTNVAAPNTAPRNAPVRLKLRSTL